jgi:anti-anti-sigma factor
MIEIIELKNTVILKPDGDITVSTVNELRDMIFKQLEKKKINMSIDFSNINLIDSVGLGVLISCYKSLEEFHGKLSLISINDELLQLFALLNLDKYFSISGKSSEE